MNIIDLDLALLIAIALLGLAVVYLWVTRRGARTLLDVAEGKLRAAQEDAANSRDIADEKGEECRKVSLKLEAALSANGTFEQSRDHIWDMYRRSSISAGNAQSWLFRELNKALFDVNRYRAKNGEDPVKAPSGLEDALADFRQEHIETPQKEVG